MNGFNFMLVSRVLVVFLFVVSAGCLAEELFKYQKDQKVDWGIIGDKEYISDRKYFSKSFDVVKVNIQSLLSGQEMVEAILPSGRVAYFNTLKIESSPTTLFWVGYVLPTPVGFDDYDVPDTEKEILKTGVFTRLIIRSKGDLQGFASKIKNKEAKKIKEKVELLGLSGEFEVFGTGERYHIFPLSNGAGHHMLLELDSEKIQSMGDSEAVQIEKVRKYKEYKDKQ